MEEIPNDTEDTKGEVDEERVVERLEPYQTKKMLVNSVCATGDAHIYLTGSVSGTKVSLSYNFKKCKLTTS